MRKKVNLSRIRSKTKKLSRGQGIRNRKQSLLEKHVRDKTMARAGCLKLNIQGRNSKDKGLLITARGEGDGGASSMPSGEGGQQETDTTWIE